MQAQPLSFNKPKPPKRLVSLTALIDMVFILLMFFMLATNFTISNSISVGVAPVSEVQGFDKKGSILIEVNEGEFLFNDEVVEEAQLAARVLAHLQLYPEAVLHIQPKVNTSIQHVIDVIDLMQQEGITNFTLVPDPQWTAKAG